MDIKQTRKYELLGLNVAYYRRRNKLTQEQLAELVGIDRTHMGNIELARSGASLDVIFGLPTRWKYRCISCLSSGTERELWPRISWANGVKRKRR